LPEHGELRQVERREVGMSGDLGTGYDKLLLERGQRSLPHDLRKCYPSKAVPEVGRQGDALPPGMVGSEGLPGEPRPRAVILAILDLLVHCLNTGFDLSRIAHRYPDCLSLPSRAGSAKAASPRENFGIWQWSSLAITGSSTRRRYFALA